jgi:hypothetical protein
MKTRPADSAVGGHFIDRPLAAFGTAEGANIQRIGSPGDKTNPPVHSWRGRRDGLFSQPVAPFFSVSSTTLENLNVRRPW